MNAYLLRAKNFKTKHRLGQNFLINEEIIKDIVSNAKGGDNILEIGAGIGFVTEGLISSGANVVAIELDLEAVSILQKKFSHASNFKLIQGDILKTNIEKLFLNTKIKIIANIPYYITTPILIHLLGEIDDTDHAARSMTEEIILMVQYEVAKRIVANENSKNKEYGMLSILSNFWADTEILTKVPKHAFYPAPKVDSALVKFKIRQNPRTKITPLLKQTVKAAFSQRRKNIKNCLKTAGFINVENALEKCGINFDLRGENLSIEDFYRLSSELKI